MTELNMLFALLRSVIFEQEIDKEIISPLDGEKLEKIYKISEKHDLSHLVCAAVDKNRIPCDGETAKKFGKEVMTALFRAENLVYEIERIGKALEKAGIDYVPLKGAVIRDKYPEPWMRTSCDVDMLVHEAQLEEAIETLKSELGYVCEDKKNYHDVDLFSPGGVHLELHFNIKENIPQLDLNLEKVWQYASPSKDGAREYKLTREFFIFHIVAHAAYHFVGGGCGIRPFLDLYLLTRENYDQKEVEKLCAECGIEEFFAAALALSDVWLGDSEHTALTRRMEEYIICGGVYGTVEAHIAARQENRGGKMGYVTSRIFVSYDHLKLKYPSLKSRAMTPFYQVRRWVDVFGKRRLSRSLNELQTTQNLDKNKVEAINSLMHDLKLNDHIK